MAFTIGMTDIGEIVFLPRLVERLSREAPGVALNTVRNTTVNLRDDMEAGRVVARRGVRPLCRRWPGAPPQPSDSP